jgi:hypothetical protein
MLMSLVSALLLLPPSAAAEYGLLIATSERSRDERGGQQRFTTHWVLIGEKTFSRTFPDLIVATNERGFLRLSIWRRCQMNRIGGFDECRDNVWIAPLGSSQRRPSTIGVAGKDPDDPCSFDKVVVGHASSRLLSLTLQAGNSESCEPRGKRTLEEVFVRTLSSRRALSIVDAVGPTSKNAYAAAAQRARSVYSDEEPEESDVLLPEDAIKAQGEDERCRADPQATRRWGIERRNGAWRPFLYQEPAGYDCRLRAPVKAEIPAHMIGSDKLPVPLKTLQAQLVTNDAFASPDGRLVVLDRGVVEIRRFQSGKLGEPLLTLPQGQIVMLQWAVGPQIQRWNIALKQQPSQTR